MVKKYNRKEYLKEYYQRPEVKKRIREYGKEYYEKNKKRRRITDKIRYEKNKDKPEFKAKRKRDQKKYFSIPKNKAKQKKQKKEYDQRPEVKTRYKELRQRPEAKKKDKERSKEYHQRPSIKIRKNKNARINHKKRYNQDKNYNIKIRLRNCLCSALKKYTKTGKIMSSKKYGIDYKSIIEYLKPFPKEISIYHIDHIRPLCSFNLENPEEIKKAFAPENHQWLLAEENISKGGRYEKI